MSETYSVWMEIPRGDAKTPFSRVAGGLSKEEAEWLARKLLFRARAMPDNTVSDS